MTTKKKTSSKKSTRKEYDNLHELLILKLQALYDVEQELVKALPKLAKAASSDELRVAFEEHLEETEGHVERLEKAFMHLDMEPKKEKVAGIRGIAEDGSWVIKNVKDDAARDAALIAAAQYAEHFEIAGYGSAREWARLMGHTEVEDLLSQTLAEEEAANQKLTELAESSINERANDMSSEEEEAVVM
jgi:ferritin-like metal-binding protein YciE